MGESPLHPEHDPSMERRLQQIEKNIDRIIDVTVQQAAISRDMAYLLEKQATANAQLDEMRQTVDTMEKALYPLLYVHSRRGVWEKAAIATLVGLVITQLAQVVPLL